MSPEVLETYIRDYCAAQHTPEISMAWQGGEPTLLGVDYFRRVVELQKKHAGGRPVSNAIQTNGTRLDAEWCRFFRENQFLVGLSLDGPRKLHEHPRSRWVEASRTAHHQPRVAPPEIRRTLAHLRV